MIYYFWATPYKAVFGLQPGFLPEIRPIFLTYKKYTCEKLPFSDEKSLAEVSLEIYVVLPEKEGMVWERMLFNSIKFLIFFPIVVLLYFLIPSKWKHIWLLVTSYFFYMCWNAKYILLILFSTVVTYFSGLGLEAAKSVQFPHLKQATVKRLIVLICVTLNLLVLFFFKYFSGFLTLLSAAFLRLHIQLNVPSFDIVLPVGISFYTFQALSYTIDVYREDIHAEKNFLYFSRSWCFCIFSFRPNGSTFGCW